MFPTPDDLATRDALKAFLRRAAPSLSVGLLAADAMAYGMAIAELEAADNALLHFDVMDGVFCPGFTAGPPLVAASRTKMLKDVHLMVADPIAIIPAVLKGGADIVHVHPEGLSHLHRALAMLDVDVSGRPGRRVLRAVALNPATPVDILESVLHEIDMVTLLAVDPGWSGGAPDAALGRKVERLRWLAKEAGADPLIAIDGGITEATIGIAASFGPDVIVSGSAVFKAGASIADNLDALRRAAGN
ncbi:ribulose-phosphate 3-epimerase [Pleomorphomonas sp. JP5]|uniref:ribulose-phosphate 3-epimerase n=1 Tax=Pleomorphomonas sp. JP5 TaxID=2942998 RepID=UPI002043784F|nr:ribulose-phosphate 3-epimerase [Pleomorphomonas sp. JP5]MCM5558167.1 ribulose-phosphate 3-epimerase [Pleomorphomonas sp. JP5]